MPRYGARRLYCANPSCDWHGRGIGVPLVRQQLIQALRQQCDAIEAAVQLASEPMDRQMTKEQAEIMSKVQAIEQLKDQGVPGLDTALESLRGQLDVLRAPVLGPDWSGLSELLAVPGVLDGFTDEELRPLVLDFVAEIVYLGNPREVEIRVRKDP